MEQPQAQPIKLISVVDLKKQMDAKPAAWLVDVRSEAEYLAAHAPGVKLVIPHTEVAAALEHFPSERTTPIYLICRSGNRSGKTARLLTDLGFSEVFNVAGGMIAWAEMGFPIERGPGILEQS